MNPRLNPWINYVIAGFVAELVSSVLAFVLASVTHSLPPARYVWIAVITYVVFIGILTMIGGVLGLIVGALDRRWARPPLWVKSLAVFMAHDALWHVPRWGAANAVEYASALACAVVGGTVCAWLARRLGRRSSSVLA